MPVKLCYLLTMSATVYLTALETLRVEALYKSTTFYLYIDRVRLIGDDLDRECAHRLHALFIISNRSSLKIPQNPESNKKIPIIHVLRISSLSIVLVRFHHVTRKCTLWRCKSTPTPKAKLLWMTSHYGPTVVRSVTEIPFHVFI